MYIYIRIYTLVYIYTDLPTSISVLEKLQILSCNHNAITKIRPEIGCCTSLHQLLFRSNRLGMCVVCVCVCMYICIWYIYLYVHTHMYLYTLCTYINTYEHKCIYVYIYTYIHTHNKMV